MLPGGWVDLRTYVIIIQLPTHATARHRAYVRSNRAIRYRVAIRREKPMKLKTASAFLLPALLLTACAETPMGPSVMVLPSQGKSYATFSQEQNFCRSQAATAVSGQAERQNHRAILGGLATTALGAGLGAAAGGGAGAAIGAGAGALGGTAGGGLYSNSKQGSLQNQYDNAYVQCMIAYKNVLPR
ncbi:hypothetical protein ACI01nite_09820 [Acetobacter cibinongensis]|uniref:Glycine-zipper-containing OmpA-like membrane domain-containing protein n=2 Tax=Acetobacter cibinongensis TaxID=146475 RepID=A0A0D6N581_9PROT|nr:hypothetical protein Abci_017_308 [Acetobacter cibinongensis]GBQ12640.1 hypothetical protein AA0482_0324 [Acetobacter cibinongensis NRIC 0482]GEL58380.1 hypothetical protein ACI01nite_09820 [Acetobacter cibinongensis]